MSNGKVYLAGPISGLTWEEAHAWRRKDGDVAAIISEWGGEILDPMAGTEMYDTGGPLSSDFDIIEGAPDPVARDLQMIDQCDVLLANLLSPRLSIGTVMEIAYAYAQRKPIVLAKWDFNNADYYGNHVFIRHMATVTRTSLNAAATAAGVLLDKRQREAVPYA